MKVKSLPWYATKKSIKKLPVLPPNTEVVFEVEGKRFYRYINELEMPAQRALSASDFYTELEQKIEKEYLSVLFDTINDCVNAGKVSEIAVLTRYAQERLNHITHLGLMYKLASVMYIGEDENPEVFDMIVAQKKIAFWQAHTKDLDAFFLQMPIGAYIPFLRAYEQNLATYSQMQASEIAQMYAYHSQALSGLKSESALREKLQKLILENEQLASFVDALSINTL
jgi:hypothetical protein